MQSLNDFVTSAQLEPAKHDVRFAVKSLRHAERTSPCDAQPLSHVVWSIELLQEASCEQIVEHADVTSELCEPSFPPEQFNAARPTTNKEPIRRLRIIIPLSPFSKDASAHALVAARAAPREALVTIRRARRAAVRVVGAAAAGRIGAAASAASENAAAVRDVLVARQGKRRPRRGAAAGIAQTSEE